MTNEEKLERVKAFLNENNIPFEENAKKCKVNLPLYVKKYNIVIHVGDDQEFFQAIRRVCHPVFIREEETADFVLEKVQNLIIERMKSMQSKIMKKNGTDNKQNRGAHQ